MECAPCDTRTALLHAALACFAETGFDGTSIRMIADRAQRPLSLLAHYFGNKEGLYVEVFKLIFEHTLFRSDRYPGPWDGFHAPRNRQEALELLQGLLLYLFADINQHCFAWDPIREFGSRLWLQEMRSPRPALAPIFDTYVKPFTVTVRKCVQLLRPDLEEPAVVILGISILGMIASHGLMRGLNQMVWPNFEEAENHPRTTEWLSDLCLHGLLGTPPQLPKILSVD